MRSLFLIFVSIPLLAGTPSTHLLSGTDQRYASIGRVRAQFQCTGTLLQPDGANDASPAYVLTAGHCVSLDPYGVIIDRAVTYTVEFNYFIDTVGRTISVRVKRVAWSTMKNADLAVFEMDATLGDLRAKGLQGFSIAAATPPQDAPLYWVGAPTANIPEGRAFMRRGDCNALGTTEVIEGQWLWHDELRTDCQDVYASASGSPLFDKSSNAIAGVIGTTSVLSFTGGPDYDCYQNRPCAVGTSGPSVETNTTYASPAAAIRDCFDTSGQFDLNSTRCTLDRGQQLSIDMGRRTADKPAARWNAPVSGAFAYYAWKQVRLDGADCRDAAGYSTPVEVARTPVIDATIGTEEGRYALCVVAGNSPSIDATWQPYRHASFRRLRIDAQPPVAAPYLEIMPQDASFRLVFNDSPPAVTTVEIKQGALASTDCSDRTGYRVLFSVPTIIRKSDFPYRVCIFYADDAGNAASPLVFDFGPPALQALGLRNSASLQRQSSVAPGSRFRVETIQLTSRSEWSRNPVPTLAGIRAEIEDSGGASHPVSMVEVRAEFIEALMPDSLPPGPARLRITAEDGFVLTTNLEIANASPGLYYANLQDFGAAMGYFTGPSIPPVTLATCTNNQFCPYNPVPAGREIDIIVFGTGVTRDIQSLNIGTEPVPVISVSPNNQWPGVDEIHVRLSPTFPLRGYQRIQIGDAGAWILFE